MRKPFAAFFALLLCSLQAGAQDPIFSQFYAAPLQINPGFAGSALAPRMGLIYRNQWTGFNNAYRTYAAFYEQSLDRLNSGLGFHVEGDDAGNGIYKTNRFSAIYAYRLKVAEKFAIKLGVEAGVHQTSLDWNQLTFPDQIDPLDGIILNTAELRPDQTNTSRLDISAGMLLLSKRWYVGGSLKHLNTPSDGILLTNDNISRGLPLRYTFHGGTEIVITEGNKRRQGSFVSPNLLFVSQGPYQQLNVGAYASAGPVFGGAWFRHTFGNSDAVILSGGFRMGIFRMGLSYDLTVSRLANFSGGTYELTLGLVFKEKKRVDINDCGRMFQ
ncbi:MAG TPA: type IX secretion system membrane protein PorP/SprF [Saprospiraceae bacterium]|nr:type IX secretion system membrane protein PorP/SprF [Saprospiraceae bacterium]